MEEWRTEVACSTGRRSVVYQVKQGQMHCTHAIFKPWHLISLPKIAPFISAKYGGIAPGVKSTVSCVA